MEIKNRQVEVTRYDAQTGRIGGHASGTLSSMYLDGIPFIEGIHDQLKCYIDLTGPTPAPRQRPATSITQNKTTITADGVDAVILSGLPVPCDVTIGEHEYHVLDGELEWSTLMPTAYKITVRAFPYLDWEGEVTAIASES